MLRRQLGFSSRLPGRYTLRTPLSLNRPRYFHQTHTKMVAEITSLKQFQDAIAQDGLVVVDFHATWCNPCKAIAPIVEKLSEQYSKDHFYKIDVDAVPDVSAENEISAMPTILLFKKGEKIGTIIGANVEKIKTLISQNATA